MRLVFVYGMKFKKDEKGNLYTTGDFNKNVWQRYIDISNNLKVLARIEDVVYSHDVAEKNFNRFNSEFVHFTPLIDNKKNIKSFFSLSSRILNKSIISNTIEESDAVVVRLPCDFGLQAIKYAKKFNKPYLLEVVGCAWDALWNHSIKGKMLAPYSYIKMKRAVKDAPYVVYVSKDFLQTRYPCNGKSLWCSDVSLREVNNNFLEERLCKIKQLSNDMPIVLGTIAGVDIRYKGQQYVIEAISRLNQIGYNFEYILVGGGDQKYLKTVAQKYNVESKVKFLGSLPHEEVFEYLRKIDIYIQPSKTEGLPRALVEAMSMACPVIGSSAGGIPELVSPEFVFKRKNARDLEEKIKKMTKEKMIDESKRSFEKAKEFDKELLDNKRKSFYLRFKNSQI